MLDQWFRLRENNTTVSTEILAGITTFLTMAYIIVVQPQVLSGRMFGQDTGMDFGAVTSATCISAAIATLIMGLYARYPIALAPGMGENFVFTLSLIPAAQAWIETEVRSGRLTPEATTPWSIALGVIFYSGVLFFVLSVLGLREKLLEAVSPSMRNAIASGIGLFIALLGLQGASIIIGTPSQIVKLSPRLASPDVIVFFAGLLVTAGLYARRIPGSIVIGIIAATVLAVLLRWGVPKVPALAENPVVKESALIQRFTPAEQVFSSPPSMASTFARMDLIHALAPPMIPFIFIFLFMDLFDTLGTLVGVSEQAGFIRDNRIPRAKQALMADATGTVVGAVCGTSTVTSFIESAAGVEQGGRTGLTAITVAVLFLVAPFFAPVIEMIGSYPPITASALLIVGSMMMKNVVKIEWHRPAEAIPAFITMTGIVFSYSIADGLALGFITYPLVKFFAGEGRQVHWLMYALAAVLVVYLVLAKAHMG
ncbi:NCS2 family permease [Thermogutta sp.]|uniref:NCS2 family permease n=1 Tax=Thermogutta sp. TaxID=1962930 RepID=UPI003C797657